MIQTYPGSIIASLGAELIVEGSCFDQNYLVGIQLQDFSATVLLAGDNAPSSIQSANNFAQISGPPNSVSHEKCLFLGRLPSAGGLTCLANDTEVSECQSRMNDVTIDW